MRQTGLVGLLRASFGSLTLYALLRQLMIHLNSGSNLANFFSYYTILSNLFAGSVLLLAAAQTGRSSRLLAVLRLISVVNMALVGIVFTALLRNVDVGSLLPWVNFVHHYLTPCVVALDWIVIPPLPRLGQREFIITLIFPLAYVIYVLARGAMIGWYPYPFLDARIVGGANGVAMYVIAITLMFGLVSIALIALANRRGKSGNQLRENEA